MAQGPSLGYKQTCNLLDMVVVHSCHKVAAVAILAYHLIIEIDVQIGVKLTHTHH